MKIRVTSSLSEDSPKKFNILITHNFQIGQETAEKDIVCLDRRLAKEMVHAWQILFVVVVVTCCNKGLSIYDVHREGGRGSRNAESLQTTV